LTNFQKILKYQNSWKSGQWQPRCTTQTDRYRWPHDEASCFSQFCEHT